MLKNSYIILKNHRNQQFPNISIQLQNFDIIMSILL